MNKATLPLGSDLVQLVGAPLISCEAPYQNLTVRPPSPNWILSSSTQWLWLIAYESFKLTKDCLVEIFDFQYQKSFHFHSQGNIFHSHQIHLQQIYFLKYSITWLMTHRLWVMVYDIFLYLFWFLLMNKSWQIGSGSVRNPSWITVEHNNDNWELNTMKTTSCILDKITW